MNERAHSPTRRMAKMMGDTGMEPDTTNSDVSDELTEDQQNAVSGGAACQDRAR